LFKSKLNINQLDAKVTLIRPNNEANEFIFGRMSCFGLQLFACVSPFAGWPGPFLIPAQICSPIATYSAVCYVLYHLDSEARKPESISVIHCFCSWATHSPFSCRHSNLWSLLYYHLGPSISLLGPLGACSLHQMFATTTHRWTWQLPTWFLTPWSWNSPPQAHLLQSFWQRSPRAYCPSVSCPRRRHQAGLDRGDWVFLLISWGNSVITQRAVGRARCCTCLWAAGEDLHQGLFVGWHA